MNSRKQNLGREVIVTHDVESMSDRILKGETAVIIDYRCGYTIKTDDGRIIAGLAEDNNYNIIGHFKFK